MAFRASKWLCNNLANRAIIYAKNGNPAEVLSALTYTPLDPPRPNTVNIRFLLAPINPADLNVIEGVYPLKPRQDATLADRGPGSAEHPVFVAGNEGLAEVMEVGDGVIGLQKRDWVVMTRQQSGTWCTRKNVSAQDIVKLPRVAQLTDVHGATLTVNPATAFNMLREFVTLKQGDWVIQNGANSAVGQAVIQIAASRGLRTLNFVRDRENLQDLIHQLEDLGATKVLTYDALTDKSLRQNVKDWTGGEDIKLGLNCVGGMETSLMARLLGTDAHLVSYGAMSKQPLSLPTSLFIFKNLTSHGYWQSRWYADRPNSEKESLMHTLVDLVQQGKLREPKHEIISISSKDSDEAAGDKVREIITRMGHGQYGKKALLRFEHDK